MSVNWAEFQSWPGTPYAYVRLALWISNEIRQGRLKAEDKLPPQRQLAKLTGVSARVVGNTIALLRADGLVITTAEGTFIVGTAADDDHTYAGDELPPRLALRARLHDDLSGYDHIAL